MKLAQLKEQIFSSGNIDNDTPDGEIGIIHQVQAEAEHILSEQLTAGNINYSETKSLMTKLMADYGQDYPVEL